MRPVRALSIFFLAVFVGGALLAPWLYWLAQSAGPHAQWLQELAESPFHRFVTRSFLLVALAGTWPLLRSLDVRSWDSLGLTGGRGAGQRLGAGFVLGLGLLAGMALLALACGARQFDQHIAGRWLDKLAGIAASAVVVATMEEFLFRGILFGALRRAHGVGLAMFGSSGIYALIHFFQKVKSPETVTWSSGLELLPAMAGGLVDAQTLLPGLLVLTVVGVMLSLAYLRTGNLWFSIGLHAGWIFWLKSYNVITDGRPGAATWFWGTNKLYDGWLALLILAPAALVLWKLPQSSREAKIPSTDIPCSAPLPKA